MMIYYLYLNTEESYHYKIYFKGYLSLVIKCKRYKRHYYPF